MTGRRNFAQEGPSDGTAGETRTDYLIMPDAVYLPRFGKKRKRRPGRNVFAILDLYCDAPRRTAREEGRRPPELSD